MQPKKIKWIIAHLPEYLFIRTANAFKQELENKLPGQFEVEILRANEYVDKYNKHESLRSLMDLSADSKPAYKDFFHAIEQADIEMGQFQVDQIAMNYNDQFNVFNMPFMFNNHDHVDSVVEGPIGKELNDSLESQGLKGLAYTYSGGFRVFGSHKPIDQLADIKKVATSRVVLGETLKTALGAEITEQASYLSTKENLPNDETPVVEATYLRFNDKVKNIYKTNHSMFITDIVISKKFWNTLTVEQQQAISEAAQSAGRTERRWSVDDADQFEVDAEQKGITIKSITPEEETLFRKNAQRMYVKYHWMFKDNLISRIKKLSK